MLKPLDVIQLRTVVDGWDAGTVATVLEVASESVLAEVADDAGRTLDVLTVPLDAVKLTSVTGRPKTSQDVPAPPSRGSRGQLARAPKRPECPKMGGWRRSRDGDVLDVLVPARQCVQCVFAL